LIELTRIGCAAPGTLRIAPVVESARAAMVAAPRRRDCVLLPFAPWKISFSGGSLTIAPAVGVCRTVVSRLFSNGVRRFADSVLIAAGDRTPAKLI
jgi:hypothetical protein